MRSEEGFRARANMFFLKPVSAPVRDSKEESPLDSETGLPITPLTIGDTVYRGEGNANIVIALPHEHKVIRFRKSLPGEVSPDAGKTRVQREVRFARNVISCFLGSYMQIPEIVRYDATDIAKLSDVIRPLRPEKRRHKEITDVYVTKFSDYTFLDLQLKHDETTFRSRSTFCVEIKPKQGYLQKAGQRFPRCPYCLHQYAKLRKKSITARSNYCPFELFSGVETRMTTAVKELLRSPQNNLKIFKDGLVVYDQESSTSDLEDVLDEWFRNAAVPCTERVSHNDEFCNLVCAALTRPVAQEQLEIFVAPRPRNPSAANQVPTFCAEPSAVTRAEWCLRFVGKNCNFDGNELPKDSVLERIWNMQRVSYVSTSYIYDVYSKYAPLLNDDLMYSGLAKLDEIRTVPRALFDKPTNLVIQTEAIKDIYLEKVSKNSVTRKYDDDDFNGDHYASSEYILSTNTDRTYVNGGFVSQTEFRRGLDSRQSFYGNKRLHNQRANDDADERKANARIAAEHLSALQNYLLFATARDCSILMTFRELQPENVSRAPVKNTIKLSDQLYFLSSVRVSDLDPKSVHSIKKHRQRDVDIFDSVNSLLEENILKNG
ncbi:inositol-pentakisphosphate 2-kinase isoform X2 [Ooceraea biroi]|nr:inositol-pentakisphosphate 2-kinase isoform X2 [Ooceraea biroi]XP_011333173.1 inositol-pentakisphosphate 2-kinase isoform X2 [Ooceraea biroi]